MSVTELGLSTLVRLVHYENAAPPIEVTESLLLHDENNIATAAIANNTFFIILC